VYLGYGFLSWAQSRAGQIEAAITNMAQAQTIRHSVSERLILTDLLEGIGAETALLAGQIDEALARARQVVEIAAPAGSLFAEGVSQRVWGRALAALTPPQWEEAEAHMAASLRAFEVGKCFLEAARTHVAWGRICRTKGNAAAAREHFEKAAAQFEASALNEELAQVKTLIAELPVPA
jgi:hypothetical protein